MPLAGGVEVDGVGAVVEDHKCDFVSFGVDRGGQGVASVGGDSDGVTQGPLRVAWAVARSIDSLMFVESPKSSDCSLL